MINRHSEQGFNAGGSKRNSPDDDWTNINLGFNRDIDTHQKTINVPEEECIFVEFREIFDLAYDKGLKGCTAFRPNPVDGCCA